MIKRLSLSPRDLTQMDCLILVRNLNMEVLSNVRTIKQQQRQSMSASKIVNQQELKVLGLWLMRREEVETSILATLLDIQEIQSLETSLVLVMVKRVYFQCYGHMKTCHSQSRV